MTTRLLIGDVFHRMAELPDSSFDLIVTSPPFLCLRSYLPEGHPQKHLEIGSEATPADYLDTLLALTAEWRRLLAPHGSIAIELGDTYAGSGGAGGDYDENGLREGQNRFKMDWKRSGLLNLSLAGIPDAYALSLAYGWNVLRRNPPDSPAGRWRVRNKKAWVRSNPPVGSLGTNNARERAATSYVTVACTGRERWFDLDAVRTSAAWHPTQTWTDPQGATRIPGQPQRKIDRSIEHPGGAPPLDWWHPIDALIDDELNTRNAVAGRPNGGNTAGPKRDSHPNGWLPPLPRTLQPAKGTHIRRRLEQAGYLTPQDFHDISPRGYSGSHYAVWPPELVKQLVLEMCPPGGTVLDPFVGSGTTLMVCSGLGRNSVGIDLDSRNADLCIERCGMFLEVDYGEREVPA